MHAKRGSYFIIFNVLLYVLFIYLFIF